MKKEIDVVQWISEKEFKRKYLRGQRPVIIKNILENQPANSKWSLDYLRKVCGDVTIDLFDNSAPGNATAFTRPDRKMGFAEYVDLIKENRPFPLRMFLFNMFKCKPVLRKDFPCPKMFRGVLSPIGYMFFGAKNAKVRIHQDMDMSNVMLTQFHGRKRVVLVDPKYSKLLYRLPLNTHSLVDLDNPDYAKYPGLQYVEMVECVLNPGDTLFIPGGYWHHITYLDSGFAVSYRKIAPGFAPKMRGLLNLCIYMPVDKLMNRIFGIRWLIRKERIAEKRANEEIAKNELRENDFRLTVGN